MFFIYKAHVYIFLFIFIFLMNGFPHHFIDYYTYEKINTFYDFKVWFLDPSILTSSFVKTF